VIRDTARSSSASPCREKKEEPEEEWEQILPELLDETRPWWVEHRELQAVLSRHPNNPANAPGQTLALANKLAVVGGAAEVVGDEQPVVDLFSDDEDVKPAVKKEGGGGSSTSGGRCYGGARHGGGHGRNGSGGRSGY
jgi:uncharacterized membrane protein YgcG